ncbi:hypothetical protein DFQ30_004330 [Apophysomyces sp. BC1015]|nr:hypothetical protein DFQ30_004330 [Apophysomyces sp. BC1015]
MIQQHKQQKCQFVWTRFLHHYSNTYQIPENIACLMNHPRGEPNLRMSSLKLRFMPPVLPQSIETEQASLVYTNEYGQRIRLRKKPGRKPNPAPPALRRAQNRVAQRVFRERENRLRDLENAVRTLREQRNRAVKELGQQRKENDVTNIRNWYLTGLVLTLHFIYMYNNIPIPVHSPYLSDENLDKIAEVSPYAVQIYSDVVRRNNASLDSTVAVDFSDCSDDSSSLSSSSREKNPTQREGTKSGAKSKGPFTPRLDVKLRKPPGLDSSKKERDGEDGEMTKPRLSDAGVVQWTRLYLRLHTFSRVPKSLLIALQPTLVQLAVTHDPRIDIVPFIHARDRLIVFSDLVDYDEIFELLVTKTSYNRGDMTAYKSYTLP